MTSRFLFLRPARLGFLASILLLALGAGGCHTLPGTDYPISRSYRATNVYAGSLPNDVRRVAVLPTWSMDARAGRHVTAIDQAMVSAVTRSARFEVVPVDRAQLQLWVGQPAVGTTNPVPARLFSEIRRRTGADAVLMVDLTHYAPYPPLAMGVRARLVRLDDGTDLWAIDELFDAANPRVAAAARRRQMQASTSPADLSHTALQSPIRFAGYAADAVAHTLPRR